MLVAVILTCEVLFWVFLLAGLTARYLVRRQRLSAVLLVCAPLVDLILLTATVVDLRGGGTATPAHALAAVYLGCSVGFGHHLIRWTDARFAHRFAGAPAPAPRPRYGQARATHERRAWLRHLLAYAVGASLILVAVVVIGDAPRTEALLDTLKLWSLVLVVDSVAAWSYTLRPRRAPARGPARP